MELMGKIARQRYIKALRANALEKTPTPVGKCGLVSLTTFASVAVVPFNVPVFETIRSVESPLSEKGDLGER